MKLKIKSSLFIGVFLLSTAAFSQQYNDYAYQRKLDRITNGWHSVTLPYELFSKINRDFSDVRLIGIKADGDTIEAPYILKVHIDKYHSETIRFNLINQVKNVKGYYYTFEISDQKFINQIELDFSKSNFDWQVELEGSHDQQEWFSIVENARILSINNSFTSYGYTSLKFNESKYKYFRLLILSSLDPELLEAKIYRNVFEKGEYIVPEIISHQINENKTNDTEISINLGHSLPVSLLKIKVKATYDYYRPITIQYVTDSIQNTKGWHYIYSTIHTSTLSSMGDSEFRFPNKIMKNIRVNIRNGDNEPLNFELSELKGNIHQLISRFDVKADYFLLYGNKNAYVPNYDISRFENNIPSKTKIIEIGDEELINIASGESAQEPLFKDSMWLWAIMIIVIFILGWFSLKMLKSK